MITQPEYLPKLDYWLIQWTTGWQLRSKIYKTQADAKRAYTRLAKKYKLKPMVGEEAIYD